jgi:MFS family permease
MNAIVLGVVAGAAYPLVDVALSCRVPESEACVWGKAYLPLSLGISIPIIGGVVAVAAYALWAWRSTRSGKGDDV